MGSRRPPGDGFVGWANRYAAAIGFLAPRPAVAGYHGASRRNKWAGGRARLLATLPVSRKVNNLFTFC
jgi:hypothetical protein